MMIRLTQEQRTCLDTEVLQRIATGTMRAQEIAEQLDGYMVDHLPARPDRFRYIDGALQRLAKAKKIKPRGGGHYGWKATGK